MTKKDHQAIARALHESRFSRCQIGNGTCELHANQDSQWVVCRDEIAKILAADNPQFSRERFVEACETGRCKGMRG